MIIVKLIGGMGNQLFQYACGRSLSILNNDRLKLDISSFDSYKLHQYSLSCFNIIQDYASAAEITKMNSNRFKKIPFLKKCRNTVFSEKNFQYDEDVLLLKGNVYLDGYFQSEKYFKDIESTIRNDLLVNIPLKGKNLETAGEIKKKNSVSVHIRRGDYISNSVTNQVHGTCSLDYYEKAIRFMHDRIGELHLFFFSDDPDWVKENLKFNFPVTYVTHNNAETNFEDLRLMSLCKNNIIANSSFSWWGAWLNNNFNKVVIAPEKWFANSDYETTDLIPKGWFQL